MSDKYAKILNALNVKMRVFSSAFLRPPITTFNFSAKSANKWINFRH